MIYLISGLAANEKVFSRLDLQNRPHTFLPWITPQEDESFDSYLDRFSKSINTGEEIILIGTSFGGIVAQELAKRLTVKKVILISSIVSENEYAPIIRFFRKSGLYKRVSIPLLLKMRPLLYHYFSIDSREEKKLLLSIIELADVNLIRWSIEKAINWKARGSLNNIYRIHGTKDLIFPVKYIGKAHLIKGGTHLMIIRNASQVNAWLQEVLEIKS